jgi:hypothetical protein
MSEPHTTSEATSSPAGREANGTFAAGNQFSRGNPFARKVAAFRAALMEAVTEKDIKDIAAKLRDDAKKRKTDAACSNVLCREATSSCVRFSFCLAPKDQSRYTRLAASWYVVSRSMTTA